MVRKPIDWDEVFAFKTVRVIRIVDRTPGLIYYCTCGLLVIYLVGYVFYSKEGHMARIQGEGQVVLEVTDTNQLWIPAKPGMRQNAFDLIDCRVPAVEREALFLTSKRYITKNQNQDVCQNINLACSSTKPCEKDALLTGECSLGYCMERAWCPFPRNLDAEAQTIKGVGTIKVTMRPDIEFVEQTYNLNKQYSAPDPVAFTVSELLSRVDVKYDDIQDSGTIVKIEFRWKCHLGEDNCDQPEIALKRLDEDSSKKGFSFEKGSYFRNSRDHFLLHGVRFVFISSGIGLTPSLQLIVLQVASALALMQGARFITDVFLLYVMTYREKYRAFKYVNTPDFSDLRARLVQMDTGGNDYQSRIDRYLSLGDGGEGTHKS